MTVFCDWLGVTVSPESWESIEGDVTAELDSIGMSVAFRDSVSTLWRSSDTTGTFRAARVGPVWALNASGKVLMGLRVAGRFASLLATVGSVPHRVTRLDATLDRQVDAAPIVDALAQAGRRGEISLTRKKVQPRHVETRIGLRFDGVESGTVYLGAKNADVLLTVYDKQHELVSRQHRPPGGPLTRYELRLRSGTGVTLRDVYDPTGVFWNFVPSNVLPTPDGVPTWAPDGSGFHIDRLPPLLPAQRLLRRVDASAELAALIVLAQSCGPYGVQLLCSHISKRAGETPSADYQPPPQPIAAMSLQ
jgi:hypothetical protein